MSGYDEALARFTAAVEADDLLEAEMALSDMKQAIVDLEVELAAAGARDVELYALAQAIEWQWESP